MLGEQETTANPENNQQRYVAPGSKPRHKQFIVFRYRANLRRLGCSLSTGSTDYATTCVLHSCQGAVSIEFVRKHTDFDTLRKPVRLRLTDVKRNRVLA